MNREEQLRLLRGVKNIAKMTNFRKTGKLASEATRQMKKTPHPSAGDSSLSGDSSSSSSQDSDSHTSDGEEDSDVQRAAIYRGERSYGSSFPDENSPLMPGSSGQGSNQTIRGLWGRINDYESNFERRMREQSQMFEQGQIKLCRNINEQFKKTHEALVCLDTKVVDGFRTTSDRLDKLEVVVVSLQNGSLGQQPQMIVCCKCQCGRRLTLTMNTHDLNGTTHYLCPRSECRNLFKTIQGLVKHIENGTKYCSCEC